MIFDKIHDMANLQEAWRKVRAANSSPGIDKVTREAFEKNLSTNLHLLSRQLRDGSYKPMPVVVYEDRKKSGGHRTIGLSTIRDKVAQQAVLRAINPEFEKIFLPCSYAYRPRKSALNAVDKASGLIRDGRLWALQLDVKNFFDTIDHGMALDFIRRVIDEKPLIRLVDKFLKSRIFREMGIFDTIRGTQQGSGLSPLLSNIYLHPLDCFMWERYKDRYLRYSDDITLFSREKEELETAAGRIQAAVEELKLSLNASKTTLSHVGEGIVYLGYCLDASGKGPSKRSVDELSEKLSVFDRLRKNDDVSGMAEHAEYIIRGWYNYYKTIRPVAPRNVPALIALARLARANGENAYARDLVRKSKEFSHRNPRAAFLLGELYQESGMRKQAIREYARAIELDPDMEAAKERVRLLQEQEPDIHEAIENIQLVLHHNPHYREGYERLAGYYRRLGLHGFAENAWQKALEIDDGAAVAAPAEPHAPLPAQKQAFDHKSIDIDTFAALFSGRKSAHARQWTDERGRWGFARVERALSKKDFVKHLRGEVTLAAYPVSETDHVDFIVFDVDAAKRKILESDPGELERFRDKTHQDILRIKKQCAEAGFDMYIEDSGYKGRHGWLFFRTSCPAAVALALGRQIVKDAGGPSENMVWELFPMGKTDRDKSLIKLPLGINRKNNRRCLFLKDNAEPYEDQGVFLKTIRKNDTQGILEAFGPKSDQDPKIAVGQDGAIQAPASLSAMVNGCGILRNLILKARDTNYLTHYERLALLYTLTFDREAGEKFLHKVISYCINYDRGYTQRQIERRKESPISCAKLREYFPELSETIPCACKLQLPPRGYPSPVLYLLETEIRQAKYPDSPEQPPPDERQAKNENAAPAPASDSRQAATQKNKEAENKGSGNKGTETKIPMLDFKSIFRKDTADPGPEQKRTYESQKPDPSARSQTQQTQDIPFDPPFVEHSTRTPATTQTSPPSPTPALDPAEQTPACVPSGQPPAYAPAEQTTSYVPAEQTPAYVPAEQTPAYVPAKPALTATHPRAGEECGRGPDTPDATELFVELLKARLQRQKLDERIRTLEELLDQCFKGPEAGLVRTRLGTLRKTKKSNGKTAFVFESDAIAAADRQRE